MKKGLVFLLLVLPFFALAQSPVIISQPYKFQKYVTVKDSLVSNGFLSNADSSNKVVTTSWAKINFGHGSAPLDSSKFWLTHGTSTLTANTTIDLNSKSLSINGGTTHVAVLTLDAANGNTALGGNTGGFETSFLNTGVASGYTGTNGLNLQYEDPTGFLRAFYMGSNGIYIYDDYNKGSANAFDYSTAIRLSDYGLMQHNTTVAVADSVKGTISTGAFWPLSGIDSLRGFTAINTGTNGLLIGSISGHGATFLLGNATDTTNAQIGIGNGGSMFNGKAAISHNGITNITFARNSDNATQGFYFGGDTSGTIVTQKTTFHNGINFKPLEYDSTIDSAKMTSNPLAIPDVQWVLAHGGSGGGTTTNSVTFNNSGSGASSGTTFDGSTARTISYNTIGAAASISGTGYSKWSGTTPSFVTVIGKADLDTTSTGVTTRSNLSPLVRAFTDPLYAPIFTATSPLHLTSNVLTVDAASDSQQGIVTTGSQNFAGGKNVKNQLGSERDAIATTHTSGLYAVNLTPATSGVPVQYSPQIASTGHVWNTSGTPADNEMDMYSELRGVSGSSPLMQLYWSSKLGSGSLTDRMKLDGNGNLSLLTGSYYSNFASGSTSDSILVSHAGVIEKIPASTYGAGTVTAVIGTTNRITSTGGATPAIDISASYVGQSSITTLGTIGTGVWNGTAIANANLANSAITLNGTSTSLGGTFTVTKNNTDTTTTGFATRLLLNNYSTKALDASTYQTLANLETTITNSATLYTSGSAVTTGLAAKLNISDTSAMAANFAHRNTNNTFAGTNTFNKPLTLAANASPSYAAGTVVYDTSQSGNGLFTAYGGDSNVSLQIGQEEWLFASNATGSTIPNGTPVYISGSSAGVPQITPAIATSGATSIAIGITTEAIANGATGYVTTSGIVHGLDTHLFSVGAIYVGTTAGALTQTAPVSPNYRYRVGFVTVVDATVGQIQVTPSTASLGNGTANQFFAMNNAGTAQELKGFTVNQGLTLSFATPGVAQLGMASISPSSIKPSVVYQTPIATTPTLDSVGVKEGGKWFATTIASLGVLSNPMTSVGDIIVGGTSGTPTRLGIGGSNTLLHGGTTPAYSGVAIADLTATGTPSSSTYLRGDNTWATVSGSGTVTSVGLTVSNGVLLGGTASPITGSGTYTLQLDSSKYQTLAAKGQASGYAPLKSTRKVDSLYLPDFYTSARFIHTGTNNNTDIFDLATVTVPFGGTGLATLTANAILTGGTTSTGVLQQLGLGTTTTVLHGNASGLATYSSVSLTADITGTLPVANGGTGQTTYTNGQLLIGNTTGNTLTKATLTGTTNQITVTNSTGSITLATPQNINTTATPQFARMGLGQAAIAGAGLSILAGTTAIAPLQIPAGTNVTSAVSGYIENDGNLPEYTNNTPARGQIPVTFATADLTAQSAAGNITTFTVGATARTYNVSAYLNITAVTVDVVETQITYTDENNTSQTVTLFNQGATSALLSAIGNSTYPPVTIRAKNATVITVKSTLTTGTGSITFDAGARITQL